MVDLKARRRVRVGDEVKYEDSVATHKRRKAIGSNNYLRAQDFEIGDTMMIGKYIANSESRGGLPYFDFEKETGEVIKVRANKALAMKMEDVKIGQWIEIVFNGTITLQDGKWKGKDCHQFDVFEVDPPEGEEESVEAKGYAFSDKDKRAPLAIEHLDSNKEDDDDEPEFSNEDDDGEEDEDEEDEDLPWLTS